MPGVPNSNDGNEACRYAEDYLHDGVKLHGGCMYDCLRLTVEGQGQDEEIAN